MKPLFLFAAALCLTLTGCGELNPDDLGKTNIDDPKTLDKILSEALTASQLQERGPAGAELVYALNSQVPYAGWTKEMHENGQVAALVHMKGGRPSGPLTEWYESGQKREEGNYVDGKPHGIATLWHENGQKKSESNFKDGEQDGLVTVWDKDGVEVK